VGTVGLVVLDVIGEHGFEMAAAEDERPVEALAPEGADHALTDGVGPGARTGLLVILVPSAARNRDSTACPDPRTARDQIQALAER
jgi:hypothetical protein